MVTGLTVLFVQATNAELQMNERFQAQQSARLAVDKIRREVHCASSVTPIGASSSITVTLPSQCPTSGGSQANIVYDLELVSANRYRLRRAGVAVADWITSNTVFTYTARRPASSRPSTSICPSIRAPRRSMSGGCRRTSSSGTRPAFDPRSGDAGPARSVRNETAVRSAARLAHAVMLKRWNEQSGMALVMAVGMLAVFSIVGTTTLVYTTSNSRSSAVSKERERAFSLAEAGLNNAMAVLSLPTNNALDSDVLPSTEATASSATYEGGTAKWYGTLDRANAVWTITSLGLYNNPTGPGVAQVRRTLTAKVPIIPTYTQPLNNPVWNYLYAGHTGSTCDQTLNNNITGSSRMYVAGNLCLSPNVQLAQSTVIVGGNLDVSNNAAVGASTSMSTRVETYVGGSCRYSVGAWGLAVATRTRGTSTASSRTARSA